MAYAFTSPIAAAGTGLAKAVRDPVRDGDNGGVRFIFDLGFPLSYPGGPKPRPAAGNPVNGATIYDVAERANGSAVVVNGQTVTYAGGGFDFGSLTAPGSYIADSGKFGDDISAPIATAPAAYTGLVQRFLTCFYMRLPADGDWDSNASFLAPIAQFSATSFQSAPELLLVAQAANSSKQLTFRRQTNGTSAVDTLNLPIAAADRGLLAQVAFTRTATEQRARVLTVNGVTTASAAVGSDNTGALTGLVGKWGIPTAFWTTPLSGMGGANKFRIYRGFLENLARSGRDPISVLDADWARVQARIVASAAANGGVSQIFVP